MAELFPAIRRHVTWLPVVAALLPAVACAEQPPPPSAPESQAEAPQLQLAAATDSGGPMQHGEFYHQGYGAYLAGLTARRQRDLGSAAVFMLEALGSDPNNRELLLEAFHLVSAEGRFEDAVALAKRVNEIEPGHALAGLVLTVDALSREDLAAAEAFAAELPEQGVSRIDKPLIAAWIAAGRGDAAAARERLAPLLGESSFATLANLHLALMLDLLGQGDQAEAIFERTLATSETVTLRLTWLVGNFFERRGDRERAQQLYENFTIDNPDSQLLEETLARFESGRTPAPMIADAGQGVAAALFDVASLLAQDLSESGLIHAHLALVLAPDVEVTRILIGEILQSHGRSEAAIAIYREIPSDSALGWPARLRISEELYNLERLDEAIAELRRLAAERPERFEALYQLGNLLRAEERFAEAAQAYDEAVARLGETRPQHWSLYYYRGITLERSDQWDRAEADFLKALELRPDEPHVMNYLAYSWIEQEMHLERALEMLVQAVELRPNDGYIVDSLGWVYYRLQRYEDAVVQLERAVELRPEDPVINDHLGDAYWRTERAREARVQWRRSLSLEPEEELVPVIEDKLDNGLTPEPEDI
jgi:tetratricopeptide (TPR) repeat protein